MTQLARLRSLIEGLPTTLPISPEGTVLPLQLDGELIAEEGWYFALNKALHAAFGHRSQGIQIRERGPALLSITSAMEQTIQSEPNSRELVELWAKDIAEAALAAGATLAEIPASKIPRKRRAINKSEEEDNESESAAAEEEGQNSESSQGEDMQRSKPKRAKQANKEGAHSNAGRKPDRLVNQVIISSLNTKAVRCAGSDCTKTFAARDRKRILKHAASCLGISGELRSQISATLASESPSAVFHNTLVAGKINSQSKSSSPLLKPSDSISQAGAAQSLVGRPGPSSEVASDGGGAAWGTGVAGNSVMAHFYQEAKKTGSASRNAEINKALMSWMTCLGLPPAILSSPYSKHFFGILSPHWKVPSSTTYATNMLPAEASYVRKAVQEHIHQLDTVSVSFDGWMSRRKESIYTVTVTEPTGRSHFFDYHAESVKTHDIQYIHGFMKAHIEAIGPERVGLVAADNTGVTKGTRRELSATFPCILDSPDPCHHLHNTVKNIIAISEFHAVVRQIGLITAFFSKSYKATGALRDIQMELYKSTRGIETIGNTRFATVYWAGYSIQHAWASLEQFGALPDLEKRFASTTKAGNATAVPLLLPRNISRFRIRLNTLLDILGPLAKSIHNLESSHVTPGDIFLHWIAIVASLKRILDDNSASNYQEFSQRTSKEIVRIINKRYVEMIDKGPTDMYLAAFLLDPFYRNSKVLKGTDRIITKDKEGNQQEVDGPTTVRVRVQLLKMLRAWLSMRNKGGGKNLAERLTHQLSLYVQGFPPFHVTPSPTQLAVDWWRPLLQIPEATLLARYATHLFSVCPTSMADERTASVMGWLNSPRRARMLASTIVSTAQVREFCRATMGYEKVLTPKRTRIDFHSINHSSIERELSARDIKKVIKFLPTKVPASVVLDETKSGQTEPSAVSSLSESPGANPEDIQVSQVLTAITDDIKTQAEEPATEAELDLMLGSSEEGDEKLSEELESDGSLESEKETDSKSTPPARGEFVIERLVNLESKYLLTLFEGDRASPGKGGAEITKGKAKEIALTDAPNDEAWDLDQFL